MARAPRLHAECDVAALVYGRSDAPDVILQSFLNELRQAGVDAVGIVQQRDAADCRQQPVGLVLIADDQRERRNDKRSSALNCGAQLSTFSAVLLNILSRRPGVVVLNRFGWLEANGSGLVGLLAQAVEHDIPVVTAVPEALFPRWLQVVEGLAVRLDCNRASLDRWWSTVARRSETMAARSPTACELYK